MANISTDQANKLDRLGDYFPGIGKTDGIAPAKLGAALLALGPITTANASDLATAIALVNDIKAKINAAVLAAGG
jgi:hypothetical protein